MPKSSKAAVQTEDEIGKDAGRFRNLYERAKAQAWNVSDDINWADIARSRSPTASGRCALIGFRPFDVLPEKDQVEVLWRRHHLHIGDILHGEQGALLLTAQLVGYMPDTESKLFASSQVSDEARHVEFFSRYLRETGAEATPCTMLRTLISTVLEDPRWEMKMITCQILIETLALSRFQEMQKETAVPLLKSALALILRDEARHVSFGTKLLLSHFGKADGAQLEEYSEFVLEQLLALGDMDADMRLADEFGWDRAALRFHLRCLNLRHPEPGRRRFRLLARNLDNVGLLRGRTRQRLEQLC